jgi:hypothetical protein
MQEQPIIHHMNDSWQYYRANIYLVEVEKEERHHR